MIKYFVMNSNNDNKNKSCHDSIILGNPLGKFCRHFSHDRHIGKKNGSGNGNFKERCLSSSAYFKTVLRRLFLLCFSFSFIKLIGLF